MAANTGIRTAGVSSAYSQQGNSLTNLLAVV